MAQRAIMGKVEELTAKLEKLEKRARQLSAQKEASEARLSSRRQKQLDRRKYILGGAMVKIAQPAKLHLWAQKHCSATDYNWLVKNKLLSPPKDKNSG